MVQTVCFSAAANGVDKRQGRCERDEMELRWPAHAAIVAMAEPTASTATGDRIFTSSVLRRGLEPNGLGTPRLLSESEHAAAAGP